MSVTIFAQRCAWAKKPWCFWADSGLQAGFFLKFPNAYILISQKSGKSQHKTDIQVSLFQTLREFKINKSNQYTLHSPTGGFCLIKHQQICFIANRLFLDRSLTTRYRWPGAHLPMCTSAHWAATGWPLSIHFQREFLFMQPQTDVGGNIFSSQHWNLRKSPVMYQ